MLETNQIGAGNKSAQQGATLRYKQKNSVVDALSNLRKTKGLSEQQQNAIGMLLQGLTDAQVGQQLSVDRGTVFRWRQNSAFVDEMNRQRQLVIDQSITRLQSMIQPALDVLQRQIVGDDPKTALRAAAILLRVATPARLRRMEEAPAAPQGDMSSDFEHELDAFLNTPPPDQPGHPNYRPDTKD